MKVHYSFDNLPVIRKPVITTGFFDGVHIGHAAIIDRLNKLAKDIDGESVLITFYPHPRRVLYPNSEGKDLMLICSQKEKEYLLEETGLDHLIIINFTKEFSHISGQSFIKDFLIQKLAVRVIVIGFNHQFGFNREGNFDCLYSLARQHGFELEEIPEQDIQNESVSSTKIRSALINGNIQRANAYLNHYYIVFAKSFPVPEILNSSNVFFYSARIEENVKLIPPDGVYAASLLSQSEVHRAILIIENMSLKDGFLNPETKILFHLIDDETIDFIENVCIRFHKRIGVLENTVNHPDIEDKLQRDIKTIKELIF